MTEKTITIILAASAFIAAAALYFLANFKSSEKRFGIVSKTISVLFTLCYSVRLFSNDEFYGVKELDIFFTKETTVFIIILRAFTMLAVLVLITAPWFKRKHLFNLAAFIVPLVYIVNIILFKVNINAFVSAGEYVQVPTYRHEEIQFAIECVLGIALGVMYLTRKIHKKEWQNPLKQLYQGALALIILTLLVMPACTLYNLIGEKGGVADDFTSTHIIMLAVIPLIIALCYAVLRKFEVKDCYYALTMMTIIAFLQFFYTFSWPPSVTSLPLHLCNAAMVLIAFTFIFKSKRVFYFNYLVNVLGAAIALLMPDITQEISTVTGIHYWFSHITLILVPILAVALKVFPRPNIKHVGYSVIVFTIYFLVVAFANAWFNSYENVSVNYFFMYDDKLINMFNWARPLKYNYITQFTINGLDFVLYPVYWAGIYGVYIVFIFLMWLVYYGAYTVADDFRNLFGIRRLKRMEMLNLKKLMQNRKITEPLYPEDKDIVRITDFTKIYSGSTVKAVDGFSLIVRGGEVYGFLGHNGAGKSTTIKSLVGIQTITQGSMTVCGYDVAKQPLEAKLRVGYVSDNHAVYEKLTGREYINYVANLYLVPQEEREQRFEKYVTMFNLKDAIDREIKGYSHGMKQKIVVIASLMHDPKVWVLDEPLTGLDPTSSFQIKECMRDHANRGNIVFFSSHVIEVVEKICDKICIIGQGKFVGEWSIKDLKSQGLTLEQLYMKYVSTQNIVTETEKGKSAVKEVEEKHNKQEGKN